MVDAFPVKTALLLNSNIGCFEIVIVGSDAGRYYVKQ